MRAQLHTALLAAAPSLLLAPTATAQSILAEDTSTLLGVDDGEITPDGRFAVLRDNTDSTSIIVLDARTGDRLFERESSASIIGGQCQDGVAVTNDRAVVIGQATQIVDLNTMTLLAEQDTGYRARDVAITPDGTIAAVRGGTDAFGGFIGGLYLLDLATGDVLAQAPGNPAPLLQGVNAFDVDSVAVTDEHAVFLSVVGESSSTPETVVTIFELRPAGGGAPRIVYESADPLRLNGLPHDLAITPDGQHVAVRSEFMVGLFRLDGTSTDRVWGQRLLGNPGPMGLATMDSIEVSDDRIATIGRYTDGAGSFGAQFDLFGLDGTQKHRLMIGDPHDLAITPSGSRAVVRTSEKVYLFDIDTLPAGDVITELSNMDLPSTHTYYGAGMDSVVVTDERAITMARDGDTTKIRFWDISDDFLTLYSSRQMSEEPTDIDITPDGSRVVVSGLTYCKAFLTETGSVIFDHDVSMDGGHPWCDGVAVVDDRAIFFGYTYTGSAGSATFGGWYTLVDLFREPTAYCPSSVNSSGAAAELEVHGSASISANDLVVRGYDLPPGAPGAFVYGNNQTSVPFGGGTICVAGAASLFGPTTASQAGRVQLQLDQGSLPGATILAGTTWNFQFLFRDSAVGQRQTTNAFSVQFGS